MSQGTEGFRRQTKTTNRTENIEDSETDSNYNEDETYLDSDEEDYRNCDIDPNIELLEKQISILIKPIQIMLGCCLWENLLTK